MTRNRYPAYYDVRTATTYSTYLNPDVNLVFKTLVPDVNLVFKKRYSNDNGRRSQGDLTERDARQTPQHDPYKVDPQSQENPAIEAASRLQNF